jgi:methylmalonyl-CoA/ethylmalonyl-CoA epimerase
MIIEVREISIAVKDVDAAAKKFAALGFNPSPIWTDPTPIIEATGASMDLPNTHIGIMASLGNNTPISRFIDKRGEGFFSITLLVTKIEDVMAKWKAEGVQFVVEKPLELRDSVNVGRITIPLIRVNWTRPSSLHGLCIELHEFRDANGNSFYPKE